MRRSIPSALAAATTLSHAAAAGAYSRWPLWLISESALAGTLPFPYARSASGTGIEP